MSRRSVLLEALAATPRDLERALRRVDDAQAAETLGQDGRSLRNVVARMATQEASYLERWRRTIARHDGDAQPVMEQLPGNGDTDALADLIARFIAQRRETLAFLRGLEQREWGTVVEEGPSPVRLRDDVQGLVTRDNEHLALLLELRMAAESTDTDR